MRIASCGLWRFRVPFKQAFQHAAHTRTESDAIIVGVNTANGAWGYGEIQARPYVTGENNDDVWREDAKLMAESVVGADLSSLEDVRALLGEQNYARKPACTGGFDIALADALEIEHGLDWQALFGDAYAQKRGRSLTVGQDADGDALKKHGRMATLSGCTVVKLKVSGRGDAERVRALRAAIGAKVALRLDANGSMQYGDARSLLDACAPYAIESIEEPLADSSDFIERMAELHAATGVDIVADESACTAADIYRLAEGGACQAVNVRVGKCGGVTGTALFLRYALERELGIVAGTMVGETPVMLRISGKMLHHCAALEYVEGIDQAKTLLEERVILAADESPSSHFGWVEAAVAKYLVDRRDVRIAD